jgi:hypothetical protein
LAWDRGEPQQVVSSFALLARRIGSTEGEFCAHWRDVHAPLVRHVDYLRGYVQHRAVRTAPGLNMPASALDGIAEFWWDDRPAALRPQGDPRYTEHAQPDEPRFLDMTRLISVQTSPVFLSGSEPAPAGTGTGALLLLVKRPALSAKAFAAMCEQAWQRAVDTMPVAPRECILHVAEPGPGEDPPAVDAIVVCHWQHVRTQRTWRASFLIDDGRDQARSSVLMTDEHIVLARPRS